MKSFLAIYLFCFSLGFSINAMASEQTLSQFSLQLSSPDNTRVNLTLDKLIRCITYQLKKFIFQFALVEILAYQALSLIFISSIFYLTTNQ